MARKPIDFSEMETFEALEKGEYECVVVKAEYTEAAEEGKYDYIRLELDVVEGGFEGKKLWTYLSFSPKALWMTKENFEALGVFEEQMEVDYDEDSMEVTEPELIGLPVVAVVDKKPYEGRESNNVLRLIDSGSPKAGAKKSTAAKPKAGATAAKGKTRQFK